MCVPGRTVEVKLLCNFSKIAKICSIFPNKGTLLNRLSWTRCNECNSFTDAHYTHWFALYTGFPFIFLSEVFKTNLKNNPSVYEQELHGELQRRITRISERIDFTPNEMKEVSLQMKWIISIFPRNTKQIRCISNY